MVPQKIDDFLYYFLKNAIGIFMGAALNLYIALNNMATLAIPILQSMDTKYFSISLCFFNLSFFFLFIVYTITD